MRIRIRDKHTGSTTPPSMTPFLPLHFLNYDEDTELDPASQTDADPDLQHCSGPKYVRPLLVLDKKSTKYLRRKTLLYVVVLFFLVLLVNLIV